MIVNKYIELQAGTKVPKEKLDTFVTEIEKIMDGALLLDEDTVVLDFDNVGDVWKDVLNLYPTRCIKTTRGAHLYYKRPVNKRINNATNARTYIGLQADYKTGFNNKKSLVTVKQNGIMREVLMILQLTIYLNYLSLFTQSIVRILICMKWTMVMVETVKYIVI